ncbi:MAG: T9SS type A sorting domain-containing protein [Lentimicrobiaceae bacterium]|nr:T9SS type A sorting domain-containing protein [Lentimicrobiaceae bacterium]
MKKYILLLFLGVTCTLNAQDIAICVPLVEQEKDSWCAVAASQCVLAYLGPNHPYVPQCKIMEYVQEKIPHTYGSEKCCTVPTPQKCNQGIYLYGQEGTVQAILSYFGYINSNPYPLFYPWPAEIAAYLRNDRPFIISLKNQYYGAQHAVVVYGMNVGGSNLIYYMDPSPGHDGGWQKETFLKLITGFTLPFSWYETLIIGDALYPLYCFDCEENYDEEGLDCGGPSCQPCFTPPPPRTCSNCEKNDGEDEIDCGGEECPPCKDLPEEKKLENSHSYWDLPSEVMALKKITAGKGVTIQYADNIPPHSVSFITEETGSIVLLPGFHAEWRSNFRAYMKDLSRYTRACPEKLCSTASINRILYQCLPDFLAISNLLYAVKIEYEIYYIPKSGGWRYVDGNVINVSHNGRVYLWNCNTGIITEGGAKYILEYTVHYCNGDMQSYTHDFYVKDCWKSLPEAPDAPEAPPQFSPPHPENTPDLSATTPPHFSIIPNPNLGTFQLETNFPLSNIGNLKITNMIGVTVFETQQLSSATLQLPNSPAGHYFVVMILKDGTLLTQKMLVQKN